jgi:quercetin dioxygenase-like cupin family protein
MRTQAMTEEIHDPVSGYWVSFERRGENLVINTRVEPGGGPPPHVHPLGEEIFSIQEGTVEYLIGREKVIARPGDEMTVPRGTRHTFKNIGDTEATFRAELRPEPTGKAEDFFRETAAAAQEGKYTQRGIPTGFRAAMELTEMLERYQEVAVMTSPPPAVQRLLFPLARRFGR